ncbi:hypothetical protein [Pseudoclavibacter chungangensis]|nr:hypothetical protein [Pseudoclavibacter chungangensis]
MSPIRVPFVASDFAHWPPFSGAPNAHPKARSESVSCIEATLVAHAIKAGSVSPLTGGANRPGLELQWRTAMVQSSLTAVGHRWSRSASYDHLDPSEKTSLSYFLGLAMASLVAEEVLGLEATAHADVVLRMLGRPIPAKERPDLIGFHPSPNGPVTPTNGFGRALIEAKGRSQGFSASALAEAKKQLADAPAVIAQLVGPGSLDVAVEAFFDRKRGRAHSVWSAHVLDPDRDHAVDSDLADDEFRALTVAGSLQSIALGIAELRADVGAPERGPLDGLTSVVLPRTDTEVGIPTPMFEHLIAQPGPFESADDLVRFTGQLLEVISMPDYLSRSFESPADSGGRQSFARLGSGLCVRTAPFGEGDAGPEAGVVEPPGVPVAFPDRVVRDNSVNEFEHRTSEGQPAPSRALNMSIEAARAEFNGTRIVSE